MKIAVVTDSASNIYHTDINMEGLFKVPLQITVNGKEYQENDVTHEYINKLLRDDAEILTSLPSIGMLEEVFLGIKELGYDAIFAVPINPNLSGTAQAMQAAANQVGINIYIHNHYSGAEVELYSALRARELFNEGKTLEEVVERLNIVAEESNTYIMPAKLDRIARSGRISTLGAKIAGLLKIVPILEMNTKTDGRLEATGTTRTMQRALKDVIKSFKDHNVSAETHKIYIAHVDAYDQAVKFKDMILLDYPGIEWEITELIPTVSIHTDIGCVATQFVRKV